jgi:heptosyltransferase-2
MQHPDFSSAKNIVLLNLIANTVGDTMMVGPLAAILKQNYPNATITVTASPQNAPLLRGLKGVDNLVELPELKLIGKKSSKLNKLLLYLKLMRRAKKVLKKLKPDVCFVLQPNFAPSQLIPWLAKVPIRIGYTFKGSIFDWALTHKTPFKGAIETGDYTHHIIESNLDLFRAVNIPIRKQDVIVHKVIPKEAEKWASDFLKSKGIKRTDKIVSFQAGAKWANKQWPPERFGEIASFLTKKYNVKILLLGTESELPQNKIIKDYAPDNCIFVVGESIDNVAALLKKSKLTLGNDSGLMHLASAVGTKPLVLYGMTIPEQSHPVGPGGFVAIQGKQYSDRPVLSGDAYEEGIKRMRSISVQKVKTIINEVLKKK